MYQMTNKHLKKTKKRKGMCRNTSRWRYTKDTKTNRNNTNTGDDNVYHTRFRCTAHLLSHIGLV